MKTPFSFLSIIAMSIIAAATITSCSKDEVLTPGQPYEIVGEEPIGFVGETADEQAINETVQLSGVSHTPDELVDINIDHVIADPGSSDNTLPVPDMNKE